MPMSDEDEKKVKDELAATKQQLTALLEKQKTDTNEAHEAEKKRKAKPDDYKPDPDMMKEIAELKLKVAELEKKQTSPLASASKRLNFFE